MAHCLMHPKLEIDHRALKIMIAVVAFTLANVTSGLANDSILSISEAYKYGGWSRDVLVGAMFAVAAFMFAYNGYRPLERVLTKATAVAALGVALFPGEVEPPGSLTQTVHTIASLVMFSTLAGLCWIFYLRAKRKHLMRANRRAVLYVICGWVMLASMLVVVVDHLMWADRCWPSSPDWFFTASAWRCWRSARLGWPQATSCPG